MVRGEVGFGRNELQVEQKGNGKGHTGFQKFTEVHASFSSLSYLAIERKSLGFDKFTKSFYLYESFFTPCGDNFLTFSYAPCPVLSRFVGHIS